MTAERHIDLRIRGAGIIGLSTAWHLSRRGFSIELVDPRPGRGASWAAAGMLAPTFEAIEDPHDNSELVNLWLASRQLWTEFGRDLAAEAELDFQFVEGPTLALATDVNQAKLLERFSKPSLRFGKTSDLLSSKELRRIEPSVSKNILCGIRLDQDGQVDNRMVIGALLRALAKRGIEPLPHATSRRAPELLTMGWQSPNMIAVKGQMLSVARQPGHPRTVLRSGSVYVAPKRDRIVIGATSERGETTSTVDHKTTEHLREQASLLCPTLAEGAVTETWAGVRPQSASGRPEIGRLNSSTLIAAGHYRNGILLAPITAQMIEDEMTGRDTTGFLSLFTPQRHLSTSEAPLVKPR